MNVKQLLRGCCILLALAGAARAEPLRVCATTPELADLVRIVGGADVDVTAFVRGREDPHFLEPRPSMIRDLNRADVLVLNGLELEVGWLPVLIQQARNADTRPGAKGYIDASDAVDVLGVPEQHVTRDMGHVHAAGNPHYMLDPVNGMRVAAYLNRRLSVLRSEAAGRFDRRYRDFKQALAVKLAGEKIAEAYDVEKLARLQSHGKMIGFLREQGRLDQLGGWWGRLHPHHGAKAVAGHDHWPYLARRFGLDVTDFLEPKPGVPPTARHLAEVIGRMKHEGIRIVIASVRFDQRHADFVASKTGAARATLVPQVGAEEGIDTYFDLLESNIERLAQALGTSDK